MTKTYHTFIEAAASSIPAITLEEMDGVKLLNRIDSKYLTNEAVLLETLPMQKRQATVPWKPKG